VVACETISNHKLGSWEAARQIGISTRLRYWERAGSGTGPRGLRHEEIQEVFSQDIERAVLVKALVEDEKYSLDGAIRKLNGFGNP
jgi:hypothetical protein